MSGVAARVCLAAVAVLLTAWLGLLLRNAVVGQSASDKVFHTPKLSAAQVDAELDRLEGARLLDPDPGLDELRAGLLCRPRAHRRLRAGRRRASYARSQTTPTRGCSSTGRRAESAPRQAAFALAQVDA